MAVRKKRVASRKTVKMGGRKGNRVAASPGKVAFGKSTLATTKGSGIRGVKKKTVNVSTVKTSLRATVTPKTGAKGRKTVAPKGKLTTVKPPFGKSTTSTAARARVVPATSTRKVIERKRVGTLKPKVRSALGSGINRGSQFTGKKTTSKKVIRVRKVKK
jgi:hypothetical protein